jgi:acetyl-CoA decarbonylase/synthase complex subunit gamma
MKICEIKQLDQAKSIMAPAGCDSAMDNGLDKPPCCGPKNSTGGGVMDEKVPGFLEWICTEGGKVPRIDSRLTLNDHLGACKARWGIGRMSYLVPAGLYAIGDPTSESPVVVTANYKMSYDIVRQTLTRRNVWMLVLETFGINVWCAAGKGTFGTDELVRRIEGTGLAGVVSHRRLILPILGATGVAAHEVAKRTGFSIKYGTIRASDLPAYLDNGMQTTPAMRKFTFSLLERLVLVPVEIVHAGKSLIFFGGIIFLVATWIGGTTNGSAALIAFLGAVLSGIAAAPILLPWIPGRSFALKGAILGLIWGICFYLLTGGSWSLPVTVASFLALPAVSAFYTLNFTGCTNFTSRSGVKKEMRISIPAMGAALLVSTLILVAGRFFN